MPGEPTPAQQPDGGAEAAMEAALHALDGSAPCSDNTCICCGVIYPRIKDVLAAWDSRAPTPPASPEREAVYRAVDAFLDAPTFATFNDYHDARTKLVNALDAERDAARKESADGA